MFESRQWRDLTHLASVESDPAKLELLFEEIRRLLDQCEAEANEGNGTTKGSLPLRLQN